jgi:class 3 adenylate cyclase
MTDENLPALLRPLDGELPAEARNLATSLRVLFNGLEISVRRYAARRSRDAGAISRYLNGSRLPPWEFILDLARDVAAYRGESIKEETLQLLRDQHRAAAESQVSPGSLLKLTQMQLAEADRRSQQSAIQIKVLTQAVQDRQTILNDVELQLREIQHRDAMNELKINRITEERNELLTHREQLQREVEALRSELRKAKRRANELEVECSSLETRLSALEGPEEGVYFTSGVMAVGMLEMVGFARLVRRLEQADLISLIEKLRRLYQHVAVTTGAKFTHTRSSDVTFVAPTASAGAETALLLTESETIESMEDMQAEVRIGLGYGPVHSPAGILLGEAVVLTERLCGIAPKDAVLASSSLIEQLIEESTLNLDKPTEGRFAAQAMWQRPVRGLGVVEPWLLTRREFPGALDERKR